MVSVLGRLMQKEFGRKRYREYCAKLKELVLPDTVTSIGKQCFMYCEGLQKADISNTAIEKIEESTFEECCSLKKIVLPSSVKEIDANAFSYCSTLTDCKYSKDAKTADNIFEGCREYNSKANQKRLAAERMAMER